MIQAPCSPSIPLGAVCVHELTQQCWGCLGIARSCPFLAAPMAGAADRSLTLCSPALCQEIPVTTPKIRLGAVESCLITLAL